MADEDERAALLAARAEAVASLAARIEAIIWAVRREFPGV